MTKVSTPRPVIPEKGVFCFRKTAPLFPELGLRY